MRPPPGSLSPLQGAGPRPDQSAAGPHCGPSREPPGAEGGSEWKGRPSSRTRVGVETCGRRQLYAHASVHAWVDVCSLQMHSLHSPCQSLETEARG